MGCTSSNDRNRNFDKQPQQTANLDPSTFPKIKVHTLLTKLKLKRCIKYQFINIRINFAGFQEFQLKPKRLINETARWDIQHNLIFQTTEYEMRKKFFILQLTEENKVIGQLKINLYLLATGPYHQDFIISLPNSQQTRISFNLKISQQISIKLKINQVCMRPKNKEFQGDQFVFCLRSIIGDNLEETNISYPFLIDFQNKKSIQNNRKNNFSIQKEDLMKTTQMVKPSKLKRLNSIRNTGNFRQNMETLHVEIVWSSSLNQKDMPYFQSQVPLYDLHGSSFSFIFYSLNNNKKQFHSQCFLSYNKLANYPFIDILDKSSHIKWEERNIDIQLKIWDHGQQQGTAKLSLGFFIQKHIKQMQVCVRTEKGILQSSPIFRQNLVGGSQVPQEISELQKLGIQIQNIFIKISDIKSSNLLLTKKYTQQICSYLKRQKQILETSFKESVIMFAYKDAISLKKSQNILLNLGFRIKILLLQDNEDISPLCWEILIRLIKRGQFILTYIGFTKEELKLHHADKMTQFLHRKKESMLSYYVLMVDLLQITFQSLETYNYESQREFAQTFCAYSYFRITKFRKEVLAAITRSSDPEIEEWRGTQFNLNQSIKINNDKQTPFSLMFDWQNHFFKVIDKEDNYKIIDEKLSQLFNQNGWQQRMKKRGGAFFAFVRYWVKFVQTIAVNSKHVQWKNFPGYNKILHSFLVQLKSKNILQYSLSMKKAAVTLLSNERLLNPFVLIILKKTNCMDQFTVLKSFDLIDTFFAAIAARGRSLPSTFDLKILNKSMKAVLQRDSAFSIGKVLLFIYNHYIFFPIEFRIETALYLLSKVFFKLFLHWSKNVRVIFHHLLFIRIYHEASKPLSQINTKDLEVYRKNPQYRTQIVSRYRKLILILENAQGFKDKIRQVKIDLYQKDAYKKLRNKINKKRKQLSGNEQYVNKKKQFFNKEQYQKQLMIQLAEPKLQRYNSEVVQGNLKIAVQKSKAVKKEEVIIKVKKKEMNYENTLQSQKKLSFFQISLENELEPLKQEEVVYISPALEEYQGVNEMFISHIEKNKDSIPIVRLEMALDEKQIRPQGLSQEMQW